MPMLFGWEIKRAGGAMTITHQSGKITGVDAIAWVGGKVIAAKGSERYILDVPYTAVD